MNRPKIKGTAGESAVVKWLCENGHPHAERRALQGAADKGDIAGLPGVMIEVKNVKADMWGKWLAETEIETRNAKADVGMLVRKRVGRSDPGQWFAVMNLETANRLLRLAGFGDPVE